MIPVAARLQFRPRRPRRLVLERSLSLRNGYGHHIVFGGHNCGSVSFGMEPQKESPWRKRRIYAADALVSDECVCLVLELRIS